jgi:hypothetical protein
MVQSSPSSQGGGSGVGWQEQRSIVNKKLMVFMGATMPTDRPYVQKKTSASRRPKLVEAAGHVV